MQSQHSSLELPHLRRQKILLLLERDGKVLAADLVQHFSVSEDTIRRDLAELAEAGLLQRVHGGALPRPKDSGRDYFSRLAAPDSEKRQLARLAVRQVKDGQIVIFDSGTTCLEVARALPLERSITVITNSPMITIALAEHKAIDVILTGGRIHAPSMSAVGHDAVRMLQGIKADVLFLGVCAIHPRMGLSTRHFDEVPVKQAMLDSASHVIAVTTADKLGAVEPFVIAPCMRLHALITETGAKDTQAYQALGIELMQADT